MFRTNWKCSFGIKQNIWNKVAWKFNIFKLYKVVNKSNVAFKSSFDFLVKKDPVLPREKKAFRVDSWLKNELLFSGIGYAVGEEWA